MTPRLREIVTYPMKSGAPRAHAEARVTRLGLAGDRELMLVDDEGVFVTQREHPELALCAVSVDADVVTVRFPTGVAIERPIPLDAPTRDVRVWRSDCRALDGGDDFAEAFSQYLKKPVRLVRLDPTFERLVNEAYGRPGDIVSFADGYPLLVVSTASLDDLNQRLAEPVAIGRFRANLVVEGTEPFEEDDWKTLEIDGVSFDVVKPCARCVMVNVDPVTAERTPEVLRTLAGYRNRRLGVIFGQNVIPRSLGTLRVGAPVQVTRA